MVCLLLRPGQEEMESVFLGYMISMRSFVRRGPSRKIRTNMPSVARK